MSELAAITVLWLFLYVYLIVSAIDFGAGLYFVYEKLADQTPVVRSLIRHYLSPFWEIINFMVIFAFVGLTSFYPEMAYYYGSVLFTPGLIVVGLIILRGVYYALTQYGVRERSIYALLFSIAGFLITTILTMPLSISEGGFINVKHGAIHLAVSTMLTSYYFWAVIGLAFVSILYISSMFFITVAHVTKQGLLLIKMRGYALFWSVPTVIMSGLVFAALQRHNPEHFTKILDLSWMFLLSLICFFIAVSLIFLNKHYLLAFLFVLLQFSFAFFGYGVSHLPFVLYPLIKLPDSVSLSELKPLLLCISAMVAAILISIGVLILRVRGFLIYSRNKKTMVK